MPERLTGKIALVTGAGRGIGKAIAIKLAREGARVAINDLDANAARETLDEVTSFGGEGIAYVGSVTDPTFGKLYVQTALDAWDDIHIIVNNAGYTWDNVIQKMTDEQFEAMLDVHLTAPFRILRAAAEHIRVRSKAEAAAHRVVTRKIVNVSSVSGTMGNPGQVGYSSAKAGVTGMTKTLAQEWGRYRVTVNCVAFGLIRTRLSQPLGGDTATIDIDGRQINVGIHSNTLDNAMLAIPLGRAGTVEEAAGCIFLFCIPESDYVSGQVIICGGGWGSTT